ncbi:MAG TPA: response regulator [Vicinamibacteria bacterium]
MKGSVPQTVLVVDTDPLQLLRTKNALSSDGARVLTCEDPVRALPLIAWENVDVVVAEVRMPSLNGIDFLARVRRLFPEVVRILLTTDETAPSLTRAINEAEVFRYLLKPSNAAELTGAVRLGFARVAQARRVANAERAATHQEAELLAMERSCPGLSDVPADGNVHSIGMSRASELSARAVGTALEGWLPG